MKPIHSRRLRRSIGARSVGLDRKIEVLDRALRMRGIPISMRPLHAWCYLGQKHNSAQISCADGPRLHDTNCATKELLEHVERWFVEHYGKRLSLEVAPGRVVLLIRGEPWIAELPKTAGALGLTISETLEAPSRLWPSATPMLAKVLDRIVDLPQGLRASIKPAELTRLTQSFTLGREALHAIQTVASRQKLISEARADLNAAVHFLTSATRHEGQARWSSLQALEKCLKGFIRQRGTPYPRVHDLHSLHAIAVAAGMPPLVAGQIGVVQCDSGVRYGEDQSTLVQAHTAYWTSLLACGHVARELQSRLPRRRRRRRTRARANGRLTASSAALAARLGQVVALGS